MRGATRPSARPRVCNHAYPLTEVVSIFRMDVMQAVFNFLGDAELECGLLVCRAWRRALATRVWRHVAVLGRGAPQPPLSEESPSRTAPQSRANKYVTLTNRPTARDMPAHAPWPLVD